MPHTVGVGWERLSRVPPCVHFSGWYKPYGPRVVWVQEYPPAGCINSSNCHALGHEHAIVSFAPDRSVSSMVCGSVCGRW